MTSSKRVSKLVTGWGLESQCLIPSSFTVPFPLACFSVWQNKAFVWALDLGKAGERIEYRGRCLVKSVLNFAKAYYSQNYFNISAPAEVPDPGERGWGKETAGWEVRAAFAEMGAPSGPPGSFWVMHWGAPLGSVPNTSPLPFIPIKLYNKRSCNPCSKSH